MPPPTPPPAELVAAEFGLGAVREPPRYAARGELGHVWRMATTSGVWAVKALVEPVDGSTGADIDFQLGLLAAGVPLPRPVRARSGAAVLTGPGGVGYRVYEWLDLAADQSVGAATAGTLLARIHARRWPATAVHPWFYRPVPAEVWPDLVARARVARAPWHGLLAGRAGDIVATTGNVTGEPPRDIFRCHLDFNADNLVVGRDGRPWVIDWENSGGADPQQELMQSLHELGGRDPVEGPGEARALLAAYRAAGGTVGRPDLASFSLAFAVQANLLALYAERALDTTRGRREQQRAAGRLATGLAGLLTVAGARRLLDVCRRG